MKTVFEKPHALTDIPFHYCPGCTHGIVHRLVAEVLDELGIEGQTVGIAPVGCSVFAYNYFNCDMIEAPHGRAPAVATGVKRANPDKTVFTYQGDGDLAAIGLGETMSAANRGENFTVIFVNNGIYGMTGGQMAPTTLVGMKATTAPKGRDPEEHGYPMHMCEILNQLTAPAYLARCSCNTPQNVMKTKKAIRKAFQNQIDGKGFSLVEIMSACPTNWGLSPLDSIKFMREKTMVEFPLGVYRDR